MKLTITNIATLSSVISTPLGTIGPGVTASGNFYGPTLEKMSNDLENLRKSGYITYSVQDDGVSSPSLELQNVNDMRNVKDGLTAKAGGGQSGATQLAVSINRVSTVATANDSVLLPVSLGGMTVIVINTAAKPIQVFGSGADTVNGIAFATGMSQPASSIFVYCCAAPGAWFVESGVGYSGQLSTYSSLDTITAFSGGGQASATPLLMQTSRVTTATATVVPFDSVKLPASAPGLEVLIINSAANSIQVFGAGTDTINGVATATGVTQMASSMVMYTAAASGAWYSNGLSTGFAGSLEITSYADGITAAGTNQGTALALSAMLNRISTAAASTGVLLPGGNPCSGGLTVTVSNAGANALAVYPQGSDTIDGAASKSIATGKTAQFTSYSPGKWHSLLSA